ncbi:MAG: cytochrome C oxidase Cbb3 [Bacteroidota bacterium]
MFKHYFEQVEGISFFPLLSLVIFVLFFLGLLIWMLQVNKDYIHEMAELPLKDDQPQSSTLDRKG